jgi:hypothetical protein
LSEIASLTQKIVHLHSTISKWTKTATVLSLGREKYIKGLKRTSLAVKLKFIRSRFELI